MNGFQKMINFILQFIFNKLYFIYIYIYDKNIWLFNRRVTIIKIVLKQIYIYILNQTCFCLKNINVEYNYTNIIKNNSIWIYYYNFCLCYWFYKKKEYKMKIRLTGC